MGLKVNFSRWVGGVRKALLDWPSTTESAAISTSPGKDDADSSSKEGKKSADAEEPKPAKPAEHVSALASPWQEAVDQYRHATKWVIGAFSAVLVAAIGTSPFLVLNEVDTNTEAAWTLWGLAAAGAGTILLIYKASELFTPMNVSLGLILRADSGPLKELKDELNSGYGATRTAVDNPPPQTWTHGSKSSPNMGWRQQDSMKDLLDWIVSLEKTRWLVDAELYELLSTDADDEAIKRVKARRTLVGDLLAEVETAIGNWQDRAAYRSTRSRFQNSRPTLFVAGVLAAFGLVAFIGAARINLDAVEADVGRPAEPSSASAPLEEGQSSPTSETEDASNELPHSLGLSERLDKLRDSEASLVANLTAWVGLAVVVMLLAWSTSRSPDDDRSSVGALLALLVLGSTVVSSAVVPLYLENHGWKAVLLPAGLAVVMVVLVVVAARLRRETKSSSL